MLIDVILLANYQVKFGQLKALLGPNLVFSSQGSWVKPWLNPSWELVGYLYLYFSFVLGDESLVNFPAKCCQENLFFMACKSQLQNLSAVPEVLVDSSIEKHTQSRCPSTFVLMLERFFVSFSIPSFQRVTSQSSRFGSRIEFVSPWGALL